MVGALVFLRPFFFLRRPLTALTVIRPGGRTLLRRLSLTHARRRLRRALLFGSATLLGLGTLLLLLGSTALLLTSLLGLCALLLRALVSLSTGLLARAAAAWARDCCSAWAPCCSCWAAALLLTSLFGLRALVSLGT